MKKLFPFLFILICVLLTVNSCSKDNIVNPKEILKDPATMHWTVDTLYYPDPESFQTLMNSIYLIDTSDIWLCGSCDFNRKQIWRYSSGKWNTYNIFNDIPLSSMTPCRLIGKDKDNIWIVGSRNERSLAVKLLNGKWYDYNIDVPSRLIDGIVSSSGQLFACGTDGIVISYNALGCVSDTIKRRKKASQYFYSLPSIAEYNNKKCVIASYIPNVSDNPEWSYYYLEGSFKQWKIIDSFKVSWSSTGNPYKFGTTKLYSSPWGKLYSCGDMGVWSWNNKSWENQISIQSPMYNVMGVRDDYIISVGDFGKFYFYNGTNWKEMPNIVPGQKDMVFWDVWTNGKVVYIVAHAGYKTLIIKGK